MSISGDTTIATTLGTARTFSTYSVTNGTGTKKWSFSDTITGLTITDTGIVTISPALAANTYYDTIIVTDSVGATAAYLITVVVNPTLTISTTNITTTFGRADSMTATSTG